MKKHSKYFYRTIARIRAVNEKNGAVLLQRIKKSFKIGYIRSYKLKQELVDAGVLREWNDNDFKKLPKGEKPKGNIVWKNLKKFRVPKEITEIETKRVKEEKIKGLFPKKIGDLYKN